MIIQFPENILNNKSLMEKLNALDDVGKVSLYAHAAVDDLANGNLLSARMNLLAICRLNPKTQAVDDVLVEWIGKE